MQITLRFPSCGFQLHWTILPADPCLADDFRYLLDSVRYENLPRFSRISDPVQSNHNVIHMVVETMGHSLSALCRFVTMFAAICSLTNFILAMDVFHFETLDFDVSRPLTTPVSPLTTAMVTAEHAMLLASANTWRCTACTRPTPLVTLLGTLTGFS